MAGNGTSAIADPDVVVIESGLSGLATALAASARGLRVVAAQRDSATSV